MSHPVEPVLLKHLYDKLDYKSGDLIEVEDHSLTGEEFVSKGEWLNTCKTINKNSDFSVERLFFVQGNPVIVFVNALTNADKIFKIYNSIWSLARPRIVFIENNGVLNIYDLASNPAKNNSELNSIEESITEISEITKKLGKYRREFIETGEVFGDKRFESVEKRADQTLINDLKKVRKRLFDNGLSAEKLKYAHALIGRSIFIRYLEDRGVLTEEYFLDVAKEKDRWMEILNTEISGPFYRDEMKNLLYPRVLADKNFTYALFRKIADDFNGDTFTTDKQEEENVDQKHLSLIKNFLIGDGNDNQLKLFLWAYRFDVIPIDLISSIYEEFYHSENLVDKKTNLLKDGKGTHYTPSSLVEFTLSRILNFEELKKHPRVLDASCGSGIFLVEAFRRMVRFELYSKKKENLEINELLQILQNQIAGIELNPEAVKIAAFSLYISFLHYQKPPSILSYIRKGGKLPFLIFHGKNHNKSQFNILLEANSFDDEKVNRVFEENSFDFVVGNPPWGTPGRDDKSGRKELKIIEKWCDTRNYEFPYKEPSHAFLWRGLDLLKPNGSCALLVKSGVLLKFSKTSNKFKQQFLNSCSLQEVINFSHVRRVFFNEAISPFLLLKFRNSKPDDSSSIDYITLRNTENVYKNKIVLLDKSDFKSIRYAQGSVNDVWKIYYWGNSLDYNLISSIRRFDSLSKYADLENTGQGFQEASQSRQPSDWLSNFKEIPVKIFTDKYSAIDFTKKSHQSFLIEVPERVKLRGKPEYFDGKRILIRRGVLQSKTPKGQIIARLETERFAFRHSLICINLEQEFEELYEVIIGILWSSLFRYYMFMTASTWGTWHQEIHKNEVLEFPTAIPEGVLKDQIIATVEELKKLNHISSNSLFESSKNKELKNLERKLDDLIFDLYELTDFERNLIIERCKFTIDLYYKGSDSIALKAIKNKNDLKPYIIAFNKAWEQSLNEGESFHSTFLMPKSSSLIGVIFHLDDKKNIRYNIAESYFEIDEVFKKIEDDLKIPISKNIFIEGMLRRVKGNKIIIIKKNQRRLWTKTEAEIDANATLLQILQN